MRRDFVLVLLLSCLPLFVGCASQGKDAADLRIGGVPISVDMQSSVAADSAPAYGIVSLVNGQSTNYLIESTEYVYVSGAFQPVASGQRAVAVTDLHGKTMSATGPAPNYEKYRVFEVSMTRSITEKRYVLVKATVDTGSGRRGASAAFVVVP